eukprot:3176183-Pyramimonas_sp.AAC.1
MPFQQVPPPVPANHRARRPLAFEPQAQRAPAPPPPHRARRPLPPGQARARRVTPPNALDVGGGKPLRVVLSSVDNILRR